MPRSKNAGAFLNRGSGYVSCRPGRSESHAGTHEWVLNIQKGVIFMKEKESFGKYILKKRKEAGLSQKALAEKLFISESAVSKWERGLSYPDITLVTSLCETLHISEHELLTASDDMHQREIEEQSRGYLRIIKTYSWITYLCYAAALIPSFICNLVIERRLTWFFILLWALSMTFSLLNVPVLAKHRRGVKSFIGFYCSLILLLCTCRILYGGTWLILSILGVSLGLLSVFLPIILNSIKINDPALCHKGAICMAVDTILVYLLVIFGCLRSVPGQAAGAIGPGLISTSIMAVWAWVIFAIFRYTRLSRLMKSFITAEICGLCIFFSQRPFESMWNQEPLTFPDIDFYNWADHFNENLGVIIIICAAVLIIFTLVRDIRNKFR